MIKEVFDEHGLLSIIPCPVDVCVDAEADGSFQINIYNPGSNLCCSKCKRLFQESLTLNHDNVCIDDFFLKGQLILAEKMVRRITCDLEELIKRAMNTEADCHTFDLEMYKTEWKEYFYQLATEEDMKQYMKTKSNNQ